MRKILFLIVLLALVSASAMAIPANEWTGHDWVQTSEDGKLYFVYGFIAAYFSVYQYVANMNVAYGIVKWLFDHAPFGETTMFFVRYLDWFYSDEHNRKVPVALALMMWPENLLGVVPH